MTSEEYADECRFEADMLTVQSDNQFLRDLHTVRAEIAAMEAESATDPDNHPESEAK